MRIIVFGVIVLLLSWCLFIYVPKIRKLPISNDALKERLRFLTETNDSYTSLESELWKTKQHLSDYKLTRKEIADYIKPLTQKASDQRTKNRSRDSDFAGLSAAIRQLDLHFLLAFSLLFTEHAIDLPDLPDRTTARDKTDAPTLNDTLDDIRSTLKGLYAARAIYQMAIEQSINKLTQEEYNHLIWLIGR